MAITKEKVNIVATRLSRDEVIVYESLSNKGRWGKDDERGVLNFITDEERMAVARLVRSGTVVSLALALPTEPAPDNPPSPI